MSALEDFADRVLDGVLCESPDLALTLGRTPSPRWRALPDYSEEGVRRRAAMVRDWADELDRLPADGDRVTRAVLAYVLKDGFMSRFNGRAAEDLADQAEPLTHISGVHVTAREMFAASALRTASDETAFIERLAALPAALREAARTAQARRARGLAAPRSVLSQALDDLSAFLRDETQAFHRRLAGRRAFDRADRLWRDEAAPAYAALCAQVEECRAAADAGGACRRPGGADFYAWRLRAHTTTRLTPDEVRARGYAEIARLDEDLQAVFAALNLPRTRAEAFAALAADDCYPSGAAGRAAALAEARAVSIEAREVTRAMFRLYPRADVEITPIPETDEISRHSTYLPPAAGERAGVFWINLRQAATSLRAETAVLTHHEAWPGHHLQIALALELPLPPFRRAMLFNAYLEGWAKYAEGLPAEAGAPDDLRRKAARLRMELYSTVNLVLDTGLNAFGWSEQEAAAFFQRETGASAAMASMVVLRALANPGQLSAYKIGLMKVRELRAQFQAARRAAFDLRDFHDALLGHGALPLDVLEDVVRRAA